MNLWSERQNLVKEFQAILSHLFQAMLKQCWYNVVSMLCNVTSTLFQRFATLFRRCFNVGARHFATLKKRLILFHFQRRINVISTLIQNVETMLIRRWNVGWDIISPRENFLRRIFYEFTVKISSLTLCIRSDNTGKYGP